MKKVCAEMWFNTYRDPDSWTSLVGCILLYCAEWERKREDDVFAAILREMRRNLPWYLMKQAEKWKIIAARKPQFARELLKAVGWESGVESKHFQAGYEDRVDWEWLFDTTDPIYLEEKKGIFRGENVQNDERGPNHSQTDVVNTENMPPVANQWLARIS
ncbi:hypothetical protein ABW19_dt0200953 [Dactylella cylindrospora]|nr:hypothetical protein ABW19_dt0200953 [Dactylella cylindrospora]